MVGRVGQRAQSQRSGGGQAPLQVPCDCAAFEKPLGTVNAALLAAAAAFVLMFVVVPAPLVDAAQAAAQSLFK